ncbi:MAG TPA: glycosyltransferase family 4 protein [Candidatus Acidoferrum sp.]|nr:glycosyltransferase family 4 protein [Candidatus Acidoferrum sp.]
MIRVLHIITRLDVGGSADNTVISATQMPREEFASCLLSGHTTDLPPALAATIARAGIPWIQLPNLHRRVSPAADCLALWGVRRAIRTLQPDIVHTHTSKAGFLGRLAARLAGVPHIVHTPHGHVFHDYFSVPTTRLFVVLERWAARWTDRIITLSDEEAADHLRRGIGRPGQFVTIPSGVDLRTVSASPRERRGSEGPVVGSVARLVPVKGLENLIAAAPEILRRCPRARFLLVGDGELRTALEAKTRELGLTDRIIFTGFREDVPSLIAGMDVFVLPSLNEGMGRVLVMAMALGKPIAATRVGGVPELLGDDEAGILVPPGDPSALADAVSTLLADSRRASALGEAGRRRATRYGAEAMITALAKLYREVMDAPPSR